MLCNPLFSVQAFVHCRLDYCNAILTGAADGQIIGDSQAVQNAAARLVSGARRRDSVSPILRIVFTGYQYDDESSSSPLLSRGNVSTASLRHIYDSSVSQWRMSVVARDCGLRQLVAFYCLGFRTLGQRSFAYSGPVEQSAPSLARKHVTMATYKTKLKTYLFRRSQ